MTTIREQQAEILQAKERLIHEIRMCIALVRCDSSEAVGDCSEFVDALIQAAALRAPVRPQDEELIGTMVYDRAAGTQHFERASQQDDEDQARSDQEIESRFAELISTELEHYAQKITKRVLRKALGGKIAGRE